MRKTAKAITDFLNAPPAPVSSLPQNRMIIENAGGLPREENLVIKVYGRQ